ncbi:MAG: hypothetical protein HY807_03775 [Nitrospirae bacterium]|nr:hypothetical protein [Nitrospirota bacterium]
MEKKNIEDMTVEELKQELEHAKECLIDEEETYNFSMHKASVHIGSLQVEAMKEDFEDNCKNYKAKISKIEELLKKKG